MSVKPPKTSRQREALALHDAGRTAGEIAKTLGVSDARAREILTLLGVRPHRVARHWPVRSKSARPVDRYNAERQAVMKQRREEIADWLTADPSLTCAEIAKRTGVSVATIQSDRRAIGMPAPHPGA